MFALQGCFHYFINLETSCIKQPEYNNHNGWHSSEWPTNDSKALTRSGWTHTQYFRHFVQTERGPNRLPNLPIQSSNQSFCLCRPKKLSRSSLEFSLTRRRQLPRKSPRRARRPSRSRDSQRGSVSVSSLIWSTVVLVTISRFNIGFKTPQEAKDGVYVDKKCPFTSAVSIRGRIFK